MPSLTSLSPAPESLFNISADDKLSFKKNGYEVLRGLAGKEDIETFRPVINRAVDKLNTERRQLKERDTYGKAFLQIMNIWKSDDDVRRFTLSKRFARAAADLLGVDNVRLYHDQALYKEPGGGPTPWHQDQYYWPLDTRDTVTLWMPLVDIDESMGILTFAAGSNNDGLVKNIAISDESDSELDDYVKQKNYPVEHPSSMKAGDATFHYGYTLHKAPGNYSNTMREVMTIIYFADGAKVNRPLNQEQENDRNTWLGGLQPGQPAASDLNPLLL